METFGTVAILLYTILAIGVIAFCAWVAPALALEISDYVLARIPAGWTVVLENAFYNLVAELNEHLHFIDQEKSRHRREDKEKLFSEMLQELHLVQEGRRTPVSIRG